MAHDVFISHSSKDKPIADAACAALEGAKVRCWIAPRDILPGQPWAEAIVGAIKNSRLMVLIFSSHSNNSNDVARELRLAVNHNVIVVPFRIEDVSPSGLMDFYLAHTHWLDAMNPPTEKQIQQLVATVGAIVRPAQARGGPQAVPSGATTAVTSSEQVIHAGAKSGLARSEGTRLPHAALVVRPHWLLGVAVLVILAGAGLLWSVSRPIPAPLTMGLSSPSVAISTVGPQALPAAAAAQGAATTAASATKPVANPLPTSPPPAPSRPGIIAVGNATQVVLRTTLTGHKEAVIGVAFLPDETTLASVSRDGTIKLWDTAAGREVRTVNLAVDDSGEKSAAFSTDGKMLALGTWSGAVSLWELGSGRMLRAIGTHKGPVKNLAFSPDSRFLASGDHVGTVKVWDANSGNEMYTLGAHANDIVPTGGIAFSPDGALLAAGNSRSGGTIWEVSSGKELRVLDNNGFGVFTGLAFSPDSNFIAGGNQRVRLWEASSGIGLPNMNGHTGSSVRVTFSPDGLVLASGSEDRTIILWNPAEALAFLPARRSVPKPDLSKPKPKAGIVPLHTLTGNAGAITQLVFSPDGKTLASASWDGTIKLWGLPSP